MAKNRKVLKLLNQFIAQLDQLSEEDLEKIEAGEATIRFEFLNTSVSKPAKEAKTKAPASTKPNSLLLETIAADLGRIVAREEGMQIIRAQTLTVAQLKSLAKSLHITLMTGDKKDQIVERIIEGTVGFRLKSQAIQHDR
jgi:hypothetical protein